MTSELPEFSFSSFVENLAGWGPTINNCFELKHLEGLPYQQYNRCDKIGRIVDWIGGIKKADNRYNERTYGSSATAGAQFAYNDEDNEGDFQLASKIRLPKQQFKGFRLFKNRKVLPKPAEVVDQQNTKVKRSIAKEHNRARKQWLSRGGNVRGLDQMEKRRQYQFRQEDNTRLPSVQVRSNWKVIEVLDFARLAQLSLPNVGLGENIPGESYGTLHLFDKKMDQVTPKNPISLKRTHEQIYSITTSEDPTIAKLANSKVGNVFATDIVLATLMTATRSVNSWDLVVSKVRNKLFIDKRDTEGHLSVIDDLTVNETAVNPPAYNAGGINSARDLAMEAVYVNQNFRRQVLKSGANDVSYKCKNERALFETDSKAQCAYRYRVWSLGNMSNGTPIKLVVRTENDGVMLSEDNKLQMLTIKAFNEWDNTLSGGIDWRTKIDSQKGAIFATEMKNNSCKLAKWTMQAILGASDFMKFGFVSRISPKNSANHVILGVTQVKPGELCKRINLNLDNCWGILRTLIDFFMKQESGDYLVLKDPLEPVIRVYCLPSDASDEYTDSEDESEADAD